jgi:hypothetical protein
MEKLCKSGGSTVGTVKVMVRPGTNVVSPEARSVLQKTTKAIEFFNLRGQRLQNSMISRTSGIIFERIISSDGSICIRKINSQIAVRYNRTGGVE